MPGSPPPPPAPPADDLTSEQRSDYLERADRLYSEVAIADDQSPGRTLITVTALTGRAAVAESRGQPEQAVALYESAASRAQAQYPEIAAASRSRAQNVGVNDTPTTLPSQSQVAAVGAKADLPVRTPVEVAGWIRALVLPEDTANADGGD
jgi:hypothetical protein